MTSAFAAPAPLTAAALPSSRRLLSTRRPRAVAAPPPPARQPARPFSRPPPSPVVRAGLAADVAAASQFVALQATAAAAGRIVYVLFHAGYCRACKAVTPKFRDLAKAHPHAAFALVRLEDARELASRLGVHSVPYVHVYDGAHGKVDEFPCSPSSLPRLRDLVEELSGPPPTDA